MGTCRACGEKFTVPTPAQATFAVAQAMDDELLLEPEPERPATRLAQPLPDRPAPRPSQYATPSREAFEQARAARRPRSYWSDALFAYVNVLTPRFILSFALLSIALGGAFALLTATPFGTRRRRGFGAVLLAYGALVLYAYEVIVHTANGEDDMPLLGWEEFREELWPALGATAATFGFLLIPSVVAGIVMLSSQTPEDTALRVLAITAGVSALFLPVTILAVALGGVSVLARFDLIVRTVFAAPLQYLALLVTLGLAGAVTLLMLLAIVNNPDGPGWVTIILFGAAQAYFGLVCARQIGLFYRHFSDRFPWSAG